MARWLLLLVPFAMFGALSIGRARILDKSQERRFEARTARRRQAYFEGDLLDSKGAARDEWDARRGSGTLGPEAPDRPSPLDDA